MKIFSWIKVISRNLVVVLTSSAIVGCGAPDPSADIEAALLEWTDSKTRVYSYSYIRWCFCPFDNVEKQVLVIDRTSPESMEVLFINAIEAADRGYVRSYSIDPTNKFLAELTVDSGGMDGEVQFSVIEFEKYE